MEGLAETSQLCKKRLFFRHPTCLQRKNPFQQAVPVACCARSQTQCPPRRTKGCLNHTTLPSSPAGRVSAAFASVQVGNGDASKWGRGTEKKKNNPVLTAGQDLRPLQMGFYSTLFFSLPFLMPGCYRSNCPINKTPSKVRKTKKSRESNKRKLPP